MLQSARRGPNQAKWMHVMTGRDVHYTSSTTSATAITVTNDKHFELIEKSINLYVHSEARLIRDCSERQFLRFF